MVITLRPAVVVGFGSYSSSCGVFCAALLKTPVLLHEQNVVAGRANQFLSRWATKVAVSFPKTLGQIPSSKMVWTGYPLRSSFLEKVTFKTPFIDLSKVQIFVFGGSQGAKHLNQVFLATARKLTEEKISFAVTHIVGDSEINEVKVFYEEFQIPAKVYAFCNDMATAYSSSDLVIARAGAGTVFELITTARPSILIPFPFAYGHQKYNAEYLSTQGAAEMIEEKDLTSELLSSKIKGFYQNPEKSAGMQNQLNRLQKNDASKQLVNLAWELSCAKN